MVEKPTVEQTAWVVRNIIQAIQERGTFRYLIYDLMGYGYEAYSELYSAGLMTFTNEGHKMFRKEWEVLKELRALLVECEWADGGLDHGTENGCPICSMTPDDGHQEDCRLGNLLKKTAPTE